MKTQKKIVIVDLSGIKAKYTLKRAGQRAPAEGDYVIVEAGIHLPAQGRYLDSRIQFHTRVYVCGCPLDSNWGTVTQDGFRSWIKEFIASTWSQAFADAEAWARGELRRLAVALTARAKALQDPD